MPLLCITLKVNEGAYVRVLEPCELMEGGILLDEDLDRIPACSMNSACNHELSA
jgi:hypothetical protein